MDPDQRIIWANEAALAMHGVEVVENLGRNVTEYVSVCRLTWLTVTQRLLTAAVYCSRAEARRDG
jgi:hypothetical protein